MQTQLILDFLRDVTANNNREWFANHRDEYEAAREDFEKGVAMAIERFASFDPSVAHLTVKDTTYRF